MDSLYFNSHLPTSNNMSNSPILPNVVHEARFGKETREQSPKPSDLPKDSSVRPRPSFLTEVNEPSPMSETSSVSPPHLIDFTEDTNSNSENVFQYSKSDSANVASAASMSDSSPPPLPPKVMKEFGGAKPKRKSNEESIVGKYLKGDTPRLTQRVRESPMDTTYIPTASVKPSIADNSRSYSQSDMAKGTNGILTSFKSPVHQQASSEIDRQSEMTRNMLKSIEEAHKGARPKRRTDQVKPIQCAPAPIMSTPEKPKDAKKPSILASDKARDVKPKNILTSSNSLEAYNKSPSIRPTRVSFDLPDDSPPLRALRKNKSVDLEADMAERERLREMLSDLRKDPFDEDLENNDGSFFPCEFCGDPYPVEFLMRHQVSAMNAK